MTPINELLAAADKVWDASYIFISQGGGAWARQLLPAINELRTVSQRLRNGQQQNDDLFRYQLAQALYALFEMRTSRPWDEVGQDGCYPEMHHDWLGAADDLIERMTNEC